MKFKQTVIAVAITSAFLSGCATSPSQKEQSLPHWSMNEAYKEDGKIFFTGLSAFHPSEKASKQDALNDAYLKFNDYIGITLTTRTKTSYRNINGKSTQSAETELTSTGKVNIQGAEVIQRKTIKTKDGFKTAVKIAIPLHIVEAEKARFSESVEPKIITKSVTISIKPGWSDYTAQKVALLVAKSSIIEEHSQNRIENKSQYDEDYKERLTSRTKGEITRFEIVSKKIDRVAENITIKLKAWIKS